MASRVRVQRTGAWRRSVKIVDRVDDLMYDGDGEPKPEMHCGHAFAPTTIKQWCIDEVEKGHPLSCPVCFKKWSYPEVRDAALLTKKERKVLEQSLVFQVSVVEAQKAKHCPICQTLIEREDENNLCVHCIFCSARSGEQIFFCWNCMNEWKGPYPRSDRCENNNCMDPKQKLLLKCNEVALENVPGVVCPSMRACPNCWTIVEHSTKMCKNIICPHCRKEFCFLCLKPTNVCCRDGGWFKMCPDGIAPRQTYMGQHVEPLPSVLTEELEDQIQGDPVDEVIRNQFRSRKKKKCWIQ